MGTAILLAVAAPIVILFLLIWRYSYWYRRGVPQGNPLKLFGDLNDISITRLPYIKHYSALARKFSEKPFYGVYSVTRPALVVRDKEIIKDILVKKFNSFGSNGLEVSEEVDPIISRDPFFQPNGARWKETRTSFSSLMTPVKLRGMFPDMTQVAHEMAEYIRELKHESGKGDGANIKSIASKSMTSILIRLTVGVDPGVFKASENPFLEAEEKLFHHLITGSLTTVMFVLSPALGRLLGMSFIPKSVVDFYSEVIDRQKEYRKANGVTRNDILDITMKKIREEKFQGNVELLHGKDPATWEVLAMVIMFIIEGFETTSTYVATAVAELARNPEIQETLREQLLSACPLGTDLTEEALNDIPLLQNCLQEAVRLYPPALFLQRIATEDATVEAKTGQKLDIKKDTRIYISIYGNNHDATLFPDPEKFDPDRFEDENQKRELMSFGDGPRQCPGQRFSALAGKLLLATLVREFKIELSPKTKMPLEPSNNPVLFSLKDIFVRLVPV